MAVVPYRFGEPSRAGNEKIPFWPFCPILVIFFNLAPIAKNDTI